MSDQPANLHPFGPITFEEADVLIDAFEALARTAVEVMRAPTTSTAMYAMLDHKLGIVRSLLTAAYEAHSALARREGTELRIPDRRAWVQP